MTAGAVGSTLCLERGRVCRASLWPGQCCRPTKVERRVGFVTSQYGLDRRDFRCHSEVPAFITSRLRNVISVSQNPGRLATYSYVAKQSKSYVCWQELTL